MIGLESWLSQATRHLAKNSIARVRTEIQEHYESTRDAAMTAGLNGEQANQLALNALGNAKSANRQYRRVLLTSLEARMLRDGNRESRAVCRNPWLKRLILAVPVLVAALAIALWLRGQEAGRDVLIAGIGMSLLLIGPFLPIYTRSRGRVFRCVKWVAMSSVLILIFGAETLKWSWLLISCLWPLALTEWTRASIRRKLPVSAWPKHLYL